LYGHSNPVLYIDPSGRLDFYSVTIGVSIASAIMTVISDNVLAAAKSKSRQLRELNFDVGGVQIGYQFNGVNCWAAAYSSMMSWYYGVPFLDIADALQHMPTGYGEYWAEKWDKSISDEETISFISESGLAQSVFTNIESPQTWYNALKKLDSPIMVPLLVSRGWAHWIVVFGIRSDGTKQGTTFVGVDSEGGLIAELTFNIYINKAFGAGNTEAVSPWIPAYWN
jgi:hypothetical protein